MKSVLASHRAHWGRLAAACAAILGTGCVENFDGSKVQLFLAQTVEVPGDDPAGNGRPPSDTHFEMYVVKDLRHFKVFEFEVKPVINRDDPCFIEDAESRYPGLHSTMFAERLIEDETAEPDGIDELEGGDLFLAERRIENMSVLAREVKVIVQYSGLSNGQIQAIYDAAGLPPVEDMSDAANEQRFEICNRLFDENPLMYVGSDKVFSLPLSGEFLGVVEGNDPRNNAYIAGSAWNIDAVLKDFDALRINWNFNDPADPRRANFSPSDVGWHFMSGVPVERVRGVINVPMTHEIFTSISGELAIFPDLSTDDVSF